MKKFTMPLFVLFSVFIFTLLTAQAQLSNEISFAAGPVFVPHATDNPIFSSASFVASTGMGVQLDYKLMSKYLGFQIAINYFLNPYDQSFSKDVLNASAVNADWWLSLMGMVKIVGRTPAINDKLFFDFNIGFGLNHGNFSNQIFTYASSDNNLLNIDQIYSSEKRSTGFLFGGGVRANYKLNQFVGIFINYDLLTSSQNYTINYVRIGPGVSSNQRSTTIKKTYHTFLFGVTSFL